MAKEQQQPDPKKKDLPGAPASLCERTACGVHKDGTYYIRATDGEDAKAIQDAAAKHGITLDHREDSAIHHGRKGVYPHFHTNDPDHLVTIMDELKGSGTASPDSAAAMTDKPGSAGQQGDNPGNTPGNTGEALKEGKAADTEAQAEKPDQSGGDTHIHLHLHEGEDGAGIPDEQRKGRGIIKAHVGDHTRTLNGKLVQVHGYDLPEHIQGCLAQTAYLQKMHGWKNPHAGTAWESTLEGDHKNAQESHEIAAGWHSAEAKKAQADGHTDGRVEGHEGAMKAHDAVAKWHGEQLAAQGHQEGGAENVVPLESKATLVNRQADKGIREGHTKDAENRSGQARTMSAYADEASKNATDAWGHNTARLLHQSAEKAHLMAHHAHQQAAEAHITMGGTAKASAKHEAAAAEHKARAEQHGSQAISHGNKFRAATEKAHPKALEGMEQSRQALHSMDTPSHVEAASKAYRASVEAAEASHKANVSGENAPHQAAADANYKAADHHAKALGKATLGKVQEAHRAAGIAHAEAGNHHGHQVTLHEAIRDAEKKDGPKPLKDTEAEYGEAADAAHAHSKGLELGGGTAPTAEAHFAAHEAHAHAADAARAHAENLAGSAAGDPSQAKDRDQEAKGYHEAADRHQKAADWHKYLGEAKLRAREKGAKGRKVAKSLDAYMAKTDLLAATQKWHSARWDAANLTKPVEEHPGLPEVLAGAFDALEAGMGNEEILAIVKQATGSSVAHYGAVEAILRGCLR
jgi:hypothetical protein